MLGPPLGGAAIGLFGAGHDRRADAVSYLLSALGIRAIGGGEPRPRARRRHAAAARATCSTGWRYILRHPALRRCSSTPSWSTA